MWSPRVQSDRSMFALEWRKMLENTPLLDFYQEMVVDLIIENESVVGVETSVGVKIYSKSVKIKIEDGIIWSNVPRKIPNRILLSLIKNYHVGDINFFWKDISDNAEVRVKNFYNLSSEKIKM